MVPATGETSAGDRLGGFEFRHFVASFDLRTDFRQIDVHEFAELFGGVFGNAHHGGFDGGIHPHVLVGVFEVLGHVEVHFAIVCFAHAAHCTAYANAAHPRHA